jgi:hypothetical protein
MVRISEIHADGRAAKTYLATLGRPDLDLLPNEVVGRAFLVDYRRHSHDAFFLLLTIVATGGTTLGIVAARFAIVPRKQFGTYRTVFY